MLTVISPHISAQDLRLEVARVVEVVPESLKILVGKKKLDSKLDLQQVLRRDANVSVKKKKKISVEIEILQEPTSPDQPMTTFFRLYPYDYISKIKSEVCIKCRVETERVDIHFRNNYLPDSMTVSDCRIRDMDCVTAHVFFRRISLRVRSTARRLHNIIVDDAGKTTVGEIKAFMRKVDRCASQSHFPVVAIHGGLVLGDSDVLINTALYPGKTEAKSAVLVLVQTNSICFSVLSALKGKLAVFCCTGEGWFHHTLARTDGEDLFVESVDPLTKQKIDNLFKMRNQTLTEEICCVHGIRQCLCYSSQQIWPGGSTRMQITSMPSSLNLGDRSCETPAASTRDLISPYVIFDASDENNKKTVGWTLGPAPSEYAATTGEEDIDNPPPAKTHSPGPQTSQLPFMSTSGRGLTRTTSAGILVKSARSKSLSREPVLNTGYPLTSSSSVRVGNRGYRSDGDTASKKYFKRSSTFECLEEIKGQWTRIQLVQNISKALIPDEVAQKMLAGDSWIPLERPEAEVPEKNSTALVQWMPDTSSNTGNATFKYIKQTTVQKVAKELSCDGFQLGHCLGVPDDKLDQIKTAHPFDLAEQNYSILRTWCQCKGAAATPEALMKTLRDCQRTDLAEIVEKTEISECNQNPLANMVTETSESKTK